MSIYSDRISQIYIFTQNSTNKDFCASPFSMLPSFLSRKCSIYLTNKKIQYIIGAHHNFIQSQIHLPASNFLIGWCMCRQMMLRKSLVYALDAFRAKFVQTYACWFSLWRICNPWMIKIPLWASITKTLMGGEAFVRGGISMLSSWVLMYTYSVLYYCTVFPELSGNLNPGLSARSHSFPALLL